MSHQHVNNDMPMPTPMPGSNPNDTMNMDDMVMHMTFFWGKNVVVLFQGWPNNSLGMYILALAFVFIVAAAVEVLSVNPRGGSRVAGGFMQTGVYAVRTALAYLVMLAVMSFNVGIFLVAIAGHAVGFFAVKYRALTAEAAGAEDAGNVSAKAGPDHILL